jgi:predicted nucleic acid-binding Zn ribbon protein
MRDLADVRRPASLVSNQRQQRRTIVNRIIWLVGAVVIILFVLGYFGLR